MSNQGKNYLYNQVIDNSQLLRDTDGSPSDRINPSTAQHSSRHPSQPTDLDSDQKPVDMFNSMADVQQEQIRNSKSVFLRAPDENSGLGGYSDKKSGFGIHIPNPRAEVEVDMPTFSDQTKSRILVSCLFALCVGNMMMLNVASFLPTYVEGTDWEDGAPSDMDVTLIISVFSVAQIVFAPFNALIKNYLGSKNTILVGFFLMTITTYGLGALEHVDDANTFKYLGIFLRFFQGQGDILLQITCYTVVTNVFSDDLMKYITYIEITVGIGLGAGPMIGSAVYNWLEYEKTMYMFGGLNTLGMLVCAFAIPSELNKTASDEEVAEFEAEMEDLLAYDIDDVTQKKKSSIVINWWTLLCNRHSMFALFVCFFGTFNISYFTGWVATELKAQDFDEANVGYVYGAMCITYLIGCLLLPYTCEHSPRKVQFVISMIGFAGCSFLLGPSAFFKFPSDNYWFTVAAFPCMGIFQVFVFIPIIPEILERLQVDLDIVEGQDTMIDNALNDKVNDAYGLTYALSNFVSPLVGSYMHSTLGSRVDTDYIAFMNLGLAAILLIFNCGPFAFSENRKFNQRLAELRGELDEEEVDTKSKLNRALSIHSKSGQGFTGPGRQRALSMNRINERTGTVNMPRITSGRMNFLDTADQRARNFIVRYKEAEELSKGDYGRARTKSESASAFNSRRG